jgi:hypothetical protein
MFSMSHTYPKNFDSQLRQQANGGARHLLQLCSAAQVDLTLNVEDRDRHATLLICNADIHGEPRCFVGCIDALNSCDVDLNPAW